MNDIVVKSVFTYRNVTCMILVNPIGGLNGYCMVLPEMGDPGKVSVHGGITWDGDSILEDGVRWYGWDTCHAGDYQKDFNPNGKRWDLNMVKLETMRMVDGLLEGK